MTNDHEPEGVDGATTDQQGAARRMPNGASVSRALRRDAGIITTSRGRAGFHISDGGREWGGVAVSVDTEDVEAANVRRAADLHAYLAAAGWDVTLAPGSSILYVTGVPSAREAANRAAARAEGERMPGMKQPLFDVVLNVFGDTNTGGGVYDVTIVDRYDAPGHTLGDVIGRHEASSFDDAMAFARGAVTAFMEGTQA